VEIAGYFFGGFGGGGSAVPLDGAGDDVDEADGVEGEGGGRVSGEVL